MTGLMAALIFGVAYPLISLAVWTLGAFGIAATKPERQAAAQARAKREWSSAAYEARYGRSYYLTATGMLWLVAVLAGALWPIAFPLWFGYRKGSFVADALEKRSVRDAEALRIVKDSAA